MTRILGIDMGERRIGLAISTPEGRLAVPLRILERQRGTDDIEAIAELARSEQVEAFVVGHPRSLSGAVGPEAQRAEAFARRLRDATGLAVELWDERLTSKQAERSTRATGRRGPSDDVAAAIILQSYLDRQQQA